MLGCSVGRASSSSTMPHVNPGAVLRSDPQTSVRLDEKLSAEDKVDAVIGLYAANVTEAWPT
jgi:hypothetical protein